MPFQQISLDQSIYNKQKPKWGSNVQQSGIKQRGTTSGGNVDTTNSFVERQKAEWAAEDKAKKAEREARMAQLQNIGAQTVQQAQQTTLAQAKQQQEVKQQIESDPEPAAKEMYELMKTLPDDAKQQLLQQVFTPTSTGGFISAGNKKVDMPDKYNPIANVFLEKGWAMFDPKGNVNLSEPEPTYEKGTFEEKSDGSLYNSATGETIIEKDNIPSGFTVKEIADGLNYGRLYMGSLTEPTLLEKITPENMSTFMENAREESRKATENYLYAIGRNRGLTREQAHNIAYSLSDEDLGGGEGTETTTDPTIVSDLKKLFDENPDEIANRKAYEDRYGAENVAAALGEINKIKPTTPVINQKPTSAGGGGSIKAF